VRIKISRLNGSVLNATPEYDDCQRIATEKKIPLKDVLAAANYAFQNQHKPAK
jgi:pyridinium-3,5-bisthiocarboxylic acid mononucleotide nickel chelatase